MEENFNNPNELNKIDALPNIQNKSYFEETTPKIAKLKEQLEKEQKKQEEKKIINSFDEEVEENGDLLRRNNRKVITIRGFILLVSTLIISLIIIFGSVGFFGYWCYTGHCHGILDAIKPQIINNIPQQNSTVIINNYVNITVDPPTPSISPVININNIINSTGNSS